MTPFTGPMVSTADVPPQFLKPAFLVGHVPFRALQSDPRLSYALYIPPDRYDNKETTKLRLLVYAHGTRRDVSYLYNELPGFADSTPCAVLAPLFPAGLEGQHDLDSYKALKSKSLRSDLALLSMLEEVTQRWPGIETEEVFLLGFSGGGQFAHRFAFLHPERLAAVSVGAPGSVTLLDETQKWPKGVADVDTQFGKIIDVSAIRRVAIQLVIGSEDSRPHGGEEFAQWVQQLKRKLSVAQPEVDQSRATVSTPPQDRRANLHQLEGNLEEHDIGSTLEVVEGVAHAMKGPVLEIMLRFIGAQMGRHEPEVKKP